MAEDFSCILGVLKSKGIADDVINELEKNYEGLRRAFPTEDHQRISERMQQNIKSKRLRRAPLGDSQGNAQARIQKIMSIIGNQPVLWVNVVSLLSSGVILMTLGKLPRTTPT